MATNSSLHHHGKVVQIKFDTTVDVSNAISASSAMLVFGDREVPVIVAEMDRKPQSDTVHINLVVLRNASDNVLALARDSQLIVYFLPVEGMNIRNGNNINMWLEVYHTCGVLLRNDRDADFLAMINYLIDILPGKISFDVLVMHVKYIFYTIKYRRYPSSSIVEQTVGTMTSLLRRHVHASDLPKDMLQCQVHLVLKLIPEFFKAGIGENIQDLEARTEKLLGDLSPDICILACPIPWYLKYWSSRKDDFQSSMYKRFVLILIELDAGINARDKNGDTPLHIVAKSRGKDEEGVDIARALLEKEGIHVDLENASGRTPLECCVPGLVQTCIRSAYPLSLSCIASRVIRKHGGCQVQNTFTPSYSATRIVDLRPPLMLMTKKR